mmetsp:Transcript_25245/g.68623  ORF Transcript_25245/g.68623 Transcript_25245/m.68623 type:complete len:232 (-) Transcript_25245:240-935(-)
MTLASISPNSSSFFFKGVSSFSSDASWIWLWILPISVSMPMEATQPTQMPLEMAVPAKSMFSLACSSHSALGTGSVPFSTDTDSPVREACSARTVAVRSCRILRSAGTRSPTCSSTMSPGTNSLAGRSEIILPSLMTLACSPCSSFKASSAASDLLSCHTPTAAFRNRMSRMTKGSTYARRPSCWLFSSKKASRKETPAERSNTLTSVSLNCSRMSFHTEVPGCFSSSLKP